MWFIAYKQMFSRKRQTMLILLGIAFAVMVYILIAGIQLGMRQYMIEQLLNNTAHILIRGRERPINADVIEQEVFTKNEYVRWLVPPSGKRDEAKLENPQGWFEILKKEPEVLAYAPRLTQSALARSGAFKRSVVLSGIIPERQSEITNLDDYMREGKLSDLHGGSSGVILGSGVLDNLGASVGDVIQLSTGLGEGKPYKIVGVLHMGNHQMDEQFALAHITDVQTLNRTPGRISEIAVALTDIDLSQPTADRWQIYSRDKVESWEEANSAFLQMISIQDITRYVITGAILIVAAFGIYNVLSIMISQKQKEIAILRSIGYAPTKILQLFLIQGMFLGFFGGLLGLFFGYTSNRIIESIDLEFQIGKGNHLIVSFELSIFMTAFFAAQLSALIASVLPARAAAKLTPLDIIRANL